MKLTKGLFTDCAEADQPAGTYRFAKNTVNTNVLGALENEKGFTDLGFLAGTTKKPIGIVQTGESIAVFCIDTNTSIPEIGSWEDGVYSTVYSSADLNFSLNYPIKGEYRKNLSGERIVAFIDDINPPRMINLDNPDVTDIQDLSIFPQLSNPTISGYSISDMGGSLPSGAYIPITRYKSADGSTYTNWFVHPKVFYVNDDSTSTLFQKNDGCVAGTITTKAITINFANCDLTFEKIDIGYLKSEDQVITAVQTRTIDLASTTLDVTITGSESSTTLTLDEVLVGNASYVTAKAITQLNGQLVLGNLTSDALPELQEVANAIKIDYTYDATPKDIKSNTNNKSTLTNTFIPGEVYAFYLGVELLDGKRAFYHIPGRAAVSNEKDSLSVDGMSFKRFQVYDTCNYGGAATNMGFWENSTETYPNDASFGSLAGQKVRHHRMPTTRYITQNLFSGDATWGVSRLSRLGIAVSNVIIPAPIQAKIARWRIFFAKKTQLNSLTLGDDLYQAAVTTSSSGVVKKSSAGNWNISAISNSTYPFLGWGSVTTTAQTTVLRGHSPDLMASNILPDYVSLNFKMSVPLGTFTVNGTGTSGLNDPYGGFGTLGLLARTGAVYGDNVGVAIDYTTSLTTRTINNGFRKLINPTYVPQMGKIDNFDNTNAEACLWSDISTLSVTTSTLNTASQDVTAPTPFTGSLGEETFHMTYCKVLGDVHSSFTVQDLVPTEGYGAPNETAANMQGGDGFMTWMSFMTASPRQYLEAEDARAGVRVWRAFIGYSRNNWNFRHQETGNIGSYYFCKTDPSNLFSPVPAPNTVTAGGGPTCLYDLNVDELNVLKYNQDYSLQNTNEVGVIWSPTLSDETSHPTLIIYSIVQNEEAVLSSWRVFPSGNRYTMPKHKGDLINLQAIDNRNLLIHHTYTLFRTRTDANMASDGENIYLRSNDLFAIVPEEVVTSTVGYGGTQNKFACVLTKVGYAFVDDLQGKVFLYNGESLEEISSNGMRIFFRDNMGIANTSKGVFPAEQWPDNPWVYMGYTIMYDEYYNRLIVSKRHWVDISLTDKSWTASFNPITKSWVSYHDYQPNYMFSLVNGKSYAIYNNKIYQMNTGAPGTYLGNSTPFSWFVDVVQNPDPAQDKVFVAANWMTESYSSAGVPDYTDTFTHLTARSWDHATGRLDLSAFSEVDGLYQENIRNLNRVWYYNSLRDIVISSGFVGDFYSNYTLDPLKLNTNMSWFDQRRITDKFLILRLEYDNLSGNRVLLLDNNVKYRYASK